VHTYLSALSSISVLIFLIGIIALLKYFNVLKKEDGTLFSKIVMNITLPAVVFSVLAHSKSLEWQYILVALYILLSEVLILLIAWLVGRKLNMESAKLGTFMIVSAFGSSALLGYALIGQVFPSNIAAISEAVIVSEFGVGVGLFTIGTMIAIHFGSNSSVKQSPLQSLKIFGKSPLFLAIIAGLSYTMLNLPTDVPVIKEMFSAIELIAKANTFFVALTIGVLLEFKWFNSILPFMLGSIVLKLFLAPLIIWIPVSLMNISNLQLEIAILEASMPSAMLSVVLATRYGCDAQLASKLVFITTIFSIITLPVLVSIL